MRAIFTLVTFLFSFAAAAQVDMSTTLKQFKTQSQAEGMSENMYYLEAAIRGDQTRLQSIRDASSGDTQTRIQSVMDIVAGYGDHSLQAAYDGGNAIVSPETTGQVIDVNATSLTTGYGLDIDVGTNDQTRAISTDGRIFAFGNVTTAGYIDGNTDPLYPSGASSAAGLLQAHNATTTSGAAIFGSSLGSTVDGLGLAGGAIFGQAGTAAALSSPEAFSGVVAYGGNLSGTGTATGLFAQSDRGYGIYVRNSGIDQGAGQGINPNATLRVHSTTFTADGQVSIQVSDGSNGDVFEFTNDGVMRSGDLTAAGNTTGLTIRSGNAASGNSGDVNIESGTASGTRGDINLNSPEVLFSGAAALSVQTASICASVRKGSMFYNDTNDYICFCNSIGNAVQAHSPATSCF